MKYRLTYKHVIGKEFLQMLTFVYHKGLLGKHIMTLDLYSMLNDSYDLKNSGKNLNTLEVKTAVRTCGFSYSGNLLMYSTDRTMGQQCEIHIFDVSDPSQMSMSSAVR